MKNKHIVVLGQQDWESTIGSNNINIAKEFAKHNKVLYVDYAPDRNTLLSQKDNPLVQKKLAYALKGKNGIELAQENLWVLYPATVLESINWLPEGWVYDFFNKRNNKRLANCILNATKKLGFDQYILFNDSLISRAYYLKELLQPSFYIYYSRDNFSSQPFFQKHAVREEKDIIQKADLVVANSNQLAQIAQRYNPHSYDIGQGCDLSLYDPNQTTVPEDMVALPRPIIGYTGFLTSMRLSIALLEHVAQSHPEWSVVLIGPEDEAFKNSALHRLKNVHFLGNKKPEELGAYIGAFDVAINPQLVNELTQGNYPRKIDEYLAMGKPVVATKTEFMQYFEQYCYLSTDQASCVACIEQALTEDSDTLHRERIAFAHTHSWENNVQKIYDLVATTLR